MVPVLLVFTIVFLLNVIPAFAPPTWLVFSFIGFQYPSHDGVELALAGALAATLGRVTLAMLSRIIIRGKLLSQEGRRNIDGIREGLEGRRKLTFGALLFYAFSPLPSNYLFIAYGLTTMDLKLIAVPFFIGRSVSYSLWRLGSSALARRIGAGSDGLFPYLSIYFVASQLIFLYLVYLFTRVDWHALFVEKKFRKLPKQHDAERSHDQAQPVGSKQDRV